MNQFIQELKRRKVFKVAAVYAVVSWMLIQVATAITPALQLPTWTPSLVVVLLMLGFIPTLIASWAYELTPEGIKPDAQVAPATGLQSTSAQPINYVILVVVLLVAGFQVTDRFLFNSAPAANPSRASSITDVVRVSLPVGEDRSLYLGGTDATLGRPAATSLAFSNDGKLLVYSGWEPLSRGARSQLYSRPLDQERARAIEGTEGGSSPFLSPDNNWLGFYVDNTLRRIPITGGIAQTIVASTEGGRMEIYGASWGDNNHIVYADQVPGSGSGSGSARIGLYLAEATGSSGSLLADPIDSQGQFNMYTQPHMLPGGESVLFQGMVWGGDPERAEIIGLDVASGTRTKLLSNAMNPRYVAETGTLLFMRQGLLMAVGFDHKTLTLLGEPVVIAENIMQALNMPNFDWNTGVGQLAISTSGHLYIRPYPGPGDAILIATGRSSAPAWSRDGTQLYFVETDPDTSIARMMVADIKEGVPSPVRPLIAPWPYDRTVYSRNFDILEDGSFITSIDSSQGSNDTGAGIAATESLAVSELHVVFNFFELLRDQAQ